jgi:ribosomal protein L37E
MLSCSKCGAPMEEGFTVDAWDRVNRVVSTWVDGTPEKSFWFGVRLGGKRRIETKTFRCTKCGYLESYARP